MKNTKTRMKKTEVGFTLIELLVVITILGALAAGTTVWVSVANRNRDKTMTQTRMVTIATGLEAVKQAVGYYPPTSTLALKSPGMKADNIGTKVGEPNETNIGIETVYIAFNMSGVTVSTDGLEDAFFNTDDDHANQLVGTLVKTDLMEMIDAYGNPFVYIAAKDYKDVEKVAEYVNYEGQTVTVEVLVNEQTGKPIRMTSFQLFSMGPDGIPNNDDDIIYK